MRIVLRTDTRTHNNEDPMCMHHNVNGLMVIISSVDTHVSNLKKEVKMYNDKRVDPLDNKITFSIYNLEISTSSSVAI